MLVRWSLRTLWGIKDDDSTESRTIKETDLKGRGGTGGLTVKDVNVPFI